MATINAQVVVNEGCPMKVLKECVPGHVLPNILKSHLEL